MSLKRTHDFEDAAPFGFATAIGGGGVADTAIVFEGAASYDLNCTGAAKGHAAGLTVGTRICVVSFWLWLDADTSASASLIQLDNSAGAGTLQLRTGRKLRVIQVGGTAGADSAALNLSQWYFIEVLFDHSTGTASASYRIDQVDQAGATHVQAATDFGSYRLENTGTNTYHVHVDTLRVFEGSAADYPVGGIWVPPAYVGAGVYQ